jgi:hypothetical protein
MGILQAVKQCLSELVRRAQRYRRLKSPRDNLIDSLRSAPDLDLLDLRRARDCGRELSC